MLLDSMCSIASPCIDISKRSAHQAAGLASTVTPPLEVTVVQWMDGFFSPSLNPAAAERTNAFEAHELPTGMTAKNLSEWSALSHTLLYDSDGSSLSGASA